MTRSSQRANRAAHERDRSTAANAGTHVRVFGGERHRVFPAARRGLSGKNRP
jgi:hypothetical protein